MFSSWVDTNSLYIILAHNDDAADAASQVDQPEGDFV
jgi:hypothetical protein